MEDEIVLEHNGESYTASYIVTDDELVVYLPDGTHRQTTLRGLKPESAAAVHLRSYISALKR